MDQQDNAPAAPEITMTPCESSQISHHGYDPATKTLALTFVGGGATYHYDDVPQEVYDGLCNAESIGRFFHRAIKPAPFKYRKIQEQKR